MFRQIENLSFNLSILHVFMQITCLVFINENNNTFFDKTIHLTFFNLMHRSIFQGEIPCFVMTIKMTEYTQSQFLGLNCIIHNIYKPKIALG